MDQSTIFQRIMDIVTEAEAKVQKILALQAQTGRVEAQISAASSASTGTDFTAQIQDATEAVNNAKADAMIAAKAAAPKGVMITSLPKPKGTGWWLWILTTLLAVASALVEFSVNKPAFLNQDLSEVEAVLASIAVSFMYVAIGTAAGISLRLSIQNKTAEMLVYLFMSLLMIAAYGSVAYWVADQRIDYFIKYQSSTGAMIKSHFFYMVIPVGFGTVATFLGLLKKPLTPLEKAYRTAYRDFKDAERHLSALKRQALRELASRSVNQQRNATRVSTLNEELAKFSKEEKNLQNELAELKQNYDEIVSQITEPAWKARLESLKFPTEQ